MAHNTQRYGHVVCVERSLAYLCAFFCCSAQLALLKTDDVLAVVDTCLRYSPEVWLDFLQQSAHEEDAVECAALLRTHPVR